VGISGLIKCVGISVRVSVCGFQCVGIRVCVSVVGASKFFSSRGYQYVGIRVWVSVVGTRMWVLSLWVSLREYQYVRSTWLNQFQSNLTPLTD